MSRTHEFKDKAKAKAREMVEKMKQVNTGSMIGGIKGLFRGYDQISDKPKTGFHGFQSHGFQSSTGHTSGFAGSEHQNPSISAGGAPSQFQGFGSGMTPPNAYNGSGEHGNASHDPWTPKSKKSKKSKKKKKVSSSEEESTSEDDSSEDEEARRAREKKERREARKAKKAAEAAAEAEAVAAKAARKEARRAKKDAAAKEPEGGKQGDLFAVGQTVLYKNRDQVKIVGVHLDDAEPYYTVSTKSGREKQTTAANLQLCTTTPALQPKIRTDFRTHDFSGGDWKGDVETLQEVLRSLRDALGEDWVASVKKRFDGIAGGEGNIIGLDAFCSTMSHMSWTNRATGTQIVLPEKDLADWFRGADRNNDGVIDIREFLLSVALAEEPWEILEGCGDTLLMERAATLFRVFDRDQDGNMTLQDLVQMNTWLHKSCGSTKSAEEILSESRDVLQVLPTGTFEHGISLAAFTQAVKSKDIFQSVRELLCQGFEAFKCPPEHSPDCTHQKKKDDLEDLADDFAKVVELNRKAPGSLEDMDKELDKDNASTDNTPTPASPGSLDMSAFFSPQNGSSSDDQETESDGDYEDLLCG